jgi:hypothetical protein
MRVTDLEMVVLRAEIAGEDEVARRAARDQLAASGQLAGLESLQYAAFVIAVRRKFAAGWTSAEVIRYVAQVRGLLSERPDLLDPQAAETEIRRALGDNTAAPAQPGVVATAQMILLSALTASLRLDDQGVLALLAEARMVADRMIAG